MFALQLTPKGDAWVLNSSDEIFQYNGSGWTKIPGSAKDIGIGADGTVWVLGMDAVSGGFGVYKRTDIYWTKIPGAGGVRIAGDHQGGAWIVSSTGDLYYCSTSVQHKGSLNAADVAVGPNGAVWITTTENKILKQGTGSTWETKTGAASCIAIRELEHVWVANAQGQIFETDLSNWLIFPRQQGWEAQMCTALGLPNVTATNYTSLTPFQQVIGGIGLEAAEAYYFSKKQNPTTDAAINAITTTSSIKNGILGLVNSAIQDKLIKGGNDAQYNALKDWATAIYRRMRIDMAKNTLVEYEKWNENPCTYVAEGYQKPVSCHSQNSAINLFSNTPHVPTDILGKAGLKASLGTTDDVGAGVSAGLSAISFVAATASLMAGLGNAAVLGSTITAASTTAAFTSTVTTSTTVTCLYSAFGGTVGASAGTGSSAAAIGASGWSGVLAAPAAIVTFAAIFISMEAMAVYEASMPEPRLKKELGRAMSEPVQIANVLGTEDGASLFYLAFMKNAMKGMSEGVCLNSMNCKWNTPSFNDDGEVTFFCQAGFVSKFTLTYNLGGPKSFSTDNLGAGFYESIAIPHCATNIVAKGYMLVNGENLIFTENIAKPTYTCLKTYGATINPQWGYEWPLKEVGKVKFVHDGGYVAKYQIDYKLNNVAKTEEIGQQGAGFRGTYSVPEDATQVVVRGWGTTGVAWEPWHLIFEKTYPAAPNECIKTYGTTQSQQWATDCN